MLGAEHIDELRLLLARQLSYQMCVAELFKKFGIRVSRNTIAGKAYRLGIRLGRPPQDRFTYPPGHEARFKELFEAGYTLDETAEILAGEYQRPVTRNMVIGKWDRMGLRRSNRGSLAKNIQRRATTRKLHLIVPDIDDLKIPFEQRKTIETIGMKDCRWPVGDPDKSDFFFCGATIAQHSPSYCAAHHQRAHAHTIRSTGPQGRSTTNGSIGKRLSTDAFQRRAFGGHY